MKPTTPTRNGTTVIETRTPYVLKSISYTVPSATDAGVMYTVTTTDAGMTCDCTAGRYKRLCWHRKAVSTDQVTSKPRVRIQPLPPVAPVARIGITTLDALYDY